jgi:hypothetical protein
MKDRIKNIIIIGLILLLSMSFYYTYIKNKDKSEKNDTEIIKKENNQVANNNTTNTDEDIEINTEPEEINLPDKAGSIRHIKTVRPIRRIVYSNLTNQEHIELAKHFEIYFQIDSSITKLMNKYKSLSKVSVDEYRINAINELNKIFIIQDAIIDDVEILDYVEYYDMLVEIYAKNIVIQNIIDALIANDFNKISELEKTFYDIEIKHCDNMLQLNDNLLKALD